MYGRKRMKMHGGGPATDFRKLTGARRKGVRDKSTTLCTTVARRLGGGNHVKPLRLELRHVVRRASR